MKSEERAVLLSASIRSLDFPQKYPWRDEERPRAKVAARRQTVREVSQSRGKDRGNYSPLDAVGKRKIKREENARHARCGDHALAPRCARCTLAA